MYLWYYKALPTKHSFLSCRDINTPNWSLATSLATSITIFTITLYFSPNGIFGAEQFQNSLNPPVTIIRALRLTSRWESIRIDLSLQILIELGQQTITGRLLVISRLLCHFKNSVRGCWILPNTHSYFTSVNIWFSGIESAHIRARPGGNISFPIS